MGFAIAIIIIQLIFALGHFLFYKTLVRFFNIKNKRIKLALKIALIFLGVSFVLASILPFAWFYLIAASWLGFLHFFFWASVLCWVVYGIFKLAKRKFKKLRFGKLHFKITAGILFGLAILISVYGIFNAMNFQVREIEVKLPNLPKTWENKTIAFISDVHVGKINGEDFANKIVDKIMALKPDLIFIGGDYYDGHIDNIAELTKPLENLKAFRGVYFVTGNHEKFDSDKKYENAIDLARVVVMNNMMTDLDGLQIIGVDYAATTNKNKFKEVLNNMKINKSKPSILIKHAPTNLDIANDAGISFQLSGHTHVGQIYPYSWLTHLIYKGYDYGLNLFGNMQIYTSNGVGTWGPPMRVGNTPEIVLIKMLK
ncbi:MAG: metallophosphoesterase [Candidatus Gracilibacteria bacterium]|jgi:hypothetical protein